MHLVEQFLKKTAFIHSAYQGDLSFTYVLTGSGTFNSIITLPGFKIRISDLGNPNGDKALAQQTKEYLLIRYMLFCNVRNKRNANILVFGSELLPLGAYLIGDVGAVTRYLTVVGGVGVQMKYLLLDFMMYLLLVPALVLD